MQRMLDGMQISNALPIDMAKAHVPENILGDWLRSVSYMFTKVAIQFPPRSGVGSNQKGDSRISKIDPKRGCGGGRGRGCGWGRGGCVGHNPVSERHDPDYGWFHVVDCSNSRKRFYGEEFDKAGSDGRLYVFDKRKSDKDILHIQKVQQGRKYYGKELGLVPYYREYNVNDNSRVNENFNESKENRSSQGKDRYAGSRFGQSAYTPT